MIVNTLLNFLTEEVLKNKDNPLLRSLSLVVTDPNTLKSRRKKFLLYFLYVFNLLYSIFIFLLSETHKEYKEKATLFYKFFKLYFVEKDKEYQENLIKNKNRTKFFKNICKHILQSNNKFITNIEDVSDILFKHKLTDENLQKHKDLIQNLLSIINEKREEIYLMRSEVDISKNELERWVYGADIIKINPTLHERLKTVNVEFLKANIVNELSHKR